MQHATLMPAAQLGALPPAQQLAISFLARYTGPTHDLYRTMLGRWLNWCDTQGLDPLEDVTRGHVELYIRELRTTLKDSSVCTALNPVRGYYKMGCIDGIISRDPAAYARLPKVQYTRKPMVDRTDVRLFLTAAKELGPRHWCLTQMLTVMAMRVSEACSITVEQALHVEQGLRVLNYIGKGNKPASTPIPYQSLAAVDAAIGERTTGPLLTRLDGQPLTRSAASSLVSTVTKRAGIDVHLTPHYLRKLAITQGHEAGLAPTELQHLARHSDVNTTMRIYQLAQIDLGAHPVHTIGARLAI